MPTFTATVILSPSAFGLPEMPGHELRSPEMHVTAPDADTALLAVFALANSYPDEMHVGVDLIREVSRYRAAHCRSMSVGDKVHLTCPGDNYDRVWRCVNGGWEEVVCFRTALAEDER